MFKVLTGNPEPGRKYEVQVQAPDGRVLIFYNDDRNKAIAQAKAVLEPVVVEAVDPAPVIEDTPVVSASGKSKHKS